MTIQLLIVLGIMGFVALGYIIIYNGLVHARQKVREAWSGIDAQLKRRYNLIPNLINTVKGYAKHESKTLENVIQARSNAIKVPDGKVAEQAKSENMLSETLKSIFALSENYPDLKANQNFLSLQKDLAETEDLIAASRRIYNANITNLNTKIQSFPSNLVANAHNFTEADFFEIGEAARQIPKVQF